jgi:hypothetical protein
MPQDQEAHRTAPRALPVGAGARTAWHRPGQGREDASEPAAAVLAIRLLLLTGAGRARSSACAGKGRSAGGW